MVHASNECISFCDFCEVISDPLLWLLHMNILLVTTCRGDTNYTAWRHSSTLADAIYTLGLHQNSRMTKEAPFYLAELRRRTFHAARGLDVTMATFLGRPPHLQAQFADCPLPLDLSDDQIMLRGLDLESTLSQLDCDGWNTQSKMFMSTYIRVRHKLTEIRDCVLRICLGQKKDNLCETIEKLIQRCETTWQTTPAFMRYSDDLWGKNTNPGECYMKLLIYYEHLYNQFLLNRLRAKQLRSAFNSAALHDIAVTLLSTVLLFFKQRLPLQHAARDYPWLMLSYGLPAAAVLSIELLPNQPASVLPRTQLSFTVLRDLSVFVSALDWVSRGEDGEPEGNYQACQYAAWRLTGILEAALENRTLGLANTAGLEMLIDENFTWIENLWNNGEAGVEFNLVGLDLPG